MVLPDLKLRQRCLAWGHNTVIRGRPVALKSMREMRAKAVKLQGVAQNGFDRSVEGQVPHAAAPKLSVHNPILIFVPITLAKALPVENHCHKVMRW